MYHAPKHPRATLLLIHGLGASWKTWEPVVPKLPRDVRIIAIDLLGFGASPKPNWSTLDAKIQADSIVTTLLRRGYFGPLIVAGHSLGSLVAVELARRYPLTVRSLVLCSPPFYRPQADTKLFHADKRLRRLYRILEDNPSSASKMLQFADKYNLWPDTGFAIDGEAGALSFLTALDAAIVNQTSLEDAAKLKQPTTILYGRLDPFVIESNIKALVAANPHTHRVALNFVAHDINKSYASRIAHEITTALDFDKKSHRPDPIQISS